jgi:hypothetical protein
MFETRLSMTIIQTFDQVQMAASRRDHQFESSQILSLLKLHCPRRVATGKFGAVIYHQLNVFGVTTLNILHPNGWKLFMKQSTQHLKVKNSI